MAKQPHQDKDNKQPPSGAKPDTPVPAMPNMSLEDEELLVGEIEPEAPMAEAIPMALPAPPGSIPVAHAAPPSSIVEADVVVEDEVVGDEVVDDVPVEVVAADSDVFLADAVDEVAEAQAVPDSDAVPVESASAVVSVDEAVLADEVVPAQPMDSPISKAVPPISGYQETEAIVEAESEEDVLPMEEAELVGSSAVFAEPVAEDFVNEPELAEEVAEDALVSEPTDFLADEMKIPLAHMAPVAAELPVKQVASQEEFGTEEALAEEQMVEAMPASAVLTEQSAHELNAEESAVSGIREEAPASSVTSAYEPREEPASPGESMTAEPEEESAFAESEQPSEKPLSPSEIAAAALLDASDEKQPESGAVEERILDDELMTETAPAAEEVLDEEIADIAPASAIQADDVVFDEDEEIAEAAPASAMQEAAPVSDVAADVLFDEESIAEAPPASAVVEDEGVLEEEIAEAAPASEVIEAQDVFDEEDEPIAEVAPAAAIADAAPASAVIESEEIAEEDNAVLDGDEELAEAAPASAVIDSEVLADAAPASALEAEEVAEAAPESAIVEAAPASEVIESEEIAAEDDVFDEDEIADAAPASVVLDSEIAEAAPASAVQADDVMFDEDEEIAEAAPASALEAEEVAESAPASGVLFDEMAADQPLSAVEAGSAVVAEEDDFDSVMDAEEEIAEAASASGVFADEEIAEAAEASSVSAIEAEDALAADFADSAVVSAESVSSVEDATEFMDEPLPQKTAAKGKQDKNGKKDAREKPDLDETIAFDQDQAHVIDDDDLTNAEASAVQLGDTPSRKGSSISGIDPVAEALESGVGIETGKTVPSVEFDEILDDSTEGELLPSASKKTAGKQDKDDGSTEMESDFVGNKQKDAKKDKKSKKKSIAQTGDDVDLSAMYDEEEAEAVEEVEEAESDSVMFDEEEVAEAEEEIAEAEEEVAEAEEEIAGVEEEVAEAEEEDAEAEAAAVFDEEEAAIADDEEAVAEAEEAAEAEDADDLIDEEEIPAKKTKVKVKAKPAKKKPYEEDEELADDEDDAFAKKGKKSKEKEDKKRKPDAPPAPARGGKFLPMMVGLILGMIFVGGGLAAVGFFLPDEFREYSKLVVEPEKKTQQAPIKSAPPLPKSLQARQAMDKGEYKEAIDMLAASSDPVEVGTRAEARWLDYLKKQGEKIDKKDKAVEEAIKDAETAKNKVLVAQIKNTFDAKKLDELLANKENNLKEFEQVKLDKEKAEKLIDDAKKALVAAKVAPKDIEDELLAKTLQALGMSKGVLDEVNKLLKDANVNDVGDVGVKSVLKARQESEDKLNAVDDLLKKENVKGKGADGIMEIVKERTAAKKDFDDLLATVKAAFQELVDGSIVPKSDMPDKEIVNAVKIARQKAESPLAISLAQLGMSLGGIGTSSSKTVQDTFDLSKAGAELLFYKGREPLIQTPEQKLNNYILLLQDRKQNNADKIKEIMGDVEWVLSDKAKEHAESRGKATEHTEAVGKALYVKGLALRNQEQFDVARAAIADALKTVQPLDKVEAWKQLAQKSELELKDPAVYYIPRIEEFQKQRNWKPALEEASLALKAMPKSTLLHAQRAQIRYESVRGQGGKIPDETRQAIRDDAEAAGADKEDLKLSARSAYLLGLLEEELGNLKKAETLYREARDQARNAKPEVPQDVGVYNDALGNLLLRDSTEPAVEDNNNKKNDADKKKDDKVGCVPAPREHFLVIHPWSVLVVSATVAQVVPDKDDDPKNDPKLQEVMKLANELIASDKNELKGKGYILLGQVLSKQGERTEGLKAMAKGLELLYPGKGTSEMVKLLEDHPALQQPDIANIQNSDIALRHYGDGLYYYWERKYSEAEAQFKLAIRYDNQDARYQYFYGLAMWAQKNNKKKREAAIFAFEQGARLEAKNNPPIRDINLSLERIQGDLRQTLNSYRYRNFAPPPD